MASVKINLGFGEQAILSDNASSGIWTAKHQQDAKEFLRRWPRTRSVHDERDYLRQLRLSTEYNPLGVNSCDASASLRSAVRSGKLTVVIERMPRQSSECCGAPQPTFQSRAIGPSRQSFAEMAADRPGTSTVLSDAVSAPKSYSWAQRYDDVSAADLVKYLESVIASTQSAAIAPDTAPSSSLGDAHAFEYVDKMPGDGSFQIAKTPNTGKPGTWHTNPGSGQMRLYGGDGNPAVDFDFDHDHGQGIPHAHNWAISPLTGKPQRGPGLPMSILP